MNDLKESELVIRLQTDDVKAFDALYRKYHEAVYFNVLKLTKDKNVSEDILQEVFISLWEKRSTLDPLKTISGWLFVVSYNKSVSHLKKILKVSSAIAFAGINVESTSEHDMQLLETRSRLIKEAINNLSPQKRKVFELCKLQEKTYEETAKELQISKHTVKEYLSGAIAYIRHYIRTHPEYHATFTNVFILSLLLSKWSEYLAVYLMVIYGHW